MGKMPITAEDPAYLNKQEVFAAFFENQMGNLCLICELYNITILF